MALSFEESKKKFMAQTAVQSAEPMIMSMAADDDEAFAVMADSVSDDYAISGKYTWYSSYRDDKYSSIDELKNIKLDESQINITQEKNSQFIPFQMPRYYDGVDLLDMMLQVHFVNKDGDENYATPVNVTYNSDTIRFGWLIDENVTTVDGEVDFEITATGSNEKGQSYVWKSRPNGKLNILKALTGNGMVEPSSDWYQSFVSLMDEKVANATAQASAAAQSAQQAQQAVADVDNKISAAASGIKSEIQSDLDTNYAKKTDLNALSDKVNSMDGLANFGVDYDSDANSLTFKNGEAEIKKITLNSDPSAEWTTAYGKTVDAKIETAVKPVRDDLAAYKTSNDAAVKNLQDSVGNLPETLKTSYYDKEATNTLLAKKADASVIDGIRNDVTQAKNNVADMQGTVDSLNTAVGQIQGKLDDIGKNAGHEYDITYEDSKLTLMEDGTPKTQVTIVGGGGGGPAAGSTITIERIGESAITAVAGDPVVVKFRFTSVDSAGDDTGNATGTWYVGNTKVATQTIMQGENSFDITKYLHSGENQIRLTVVDSMDTTGSKKWSANVVDFYLESTFDDSLFYSGEVTVRYTPYGSVEKKIDFALDGKSIGGTTTSVTGRQMTYTIPVQKHGSHLLEISMTAEINGKTVKSNVIKKDIMWVTEGETAPIISCAVRDYETKQYNKVSIEYTVYDPASSTSTVKLAVNGVTESTLTVGRTKQTWSFKSANKGKHTLTITCGETVKTISVNVVDLGVVIEPVKTNLMFDFNPSGKTNAGTDRLWTDGQTSMTVSDNFDWVNGGYQLDKDGDTYFCVKAGTRATINYKLFADDAKKLGKNFKLVFNTANVRDYDATVLTCVQGGVGLNIQAQKITLTSAQNTMELPTCEDDFMEFEFNILPDSQYKEMVLWLDGIPCKVELYDGSDNFTQASPVGITIGSDDCDVLVYRMKTYSMNLSDDEILDNFIADAKNADEMIERYNRNNITDASGELNPDILAERCPDLRVIKISAPTFTTGKKNEVANTVIQQIYKNGRAVEDNWTAKGYHKGQGTSSDHYGESARNIDINCKGGFTFGDESTGSVYALTENSVAENYFNIKVNVASSENANNALLADDFNEFNPYIRQARKDNSKVRDTMAFYPCVVFVQETDIENSTVFHDGKWHFYACGDIGNSKKNNNTMGMDPNNHKEVIVEIDNNTDEQTRFLSGDFSHETWDGDNSFEFRYINKACTEEEVQAAKDAWIRVQNWVVNASDEEFKTHFEDYFVMDSALYHYLFTERHTMVDNRAKNVFPHTSDLIHWDFCFDYDNDTAQGNDNEGGLTLSYGYEDTDTIGTKSVFNASDSKLWCKIRDLFPDKLAAMFRDRENALAWSATRILKKFEDYQDVKPEKLWIMDMRRKYFRTYEDNGTTSYLPMMHGNKRHQRRQFQRYQEKYMASKYTGTACTSDDMTIRGYTPTNWTGVKPDGTFHIIPYADTYVSVRYGSNPVKVRGKRGQTYAIQCPIAAMNDTEVYVYNASIIQSIGDISGFYPGYVDFSHGVKLTDLKIGSATEGYKNTNMTDFAVGNNTLLEHLNLQNVPNLKKSISLTGCTNLEEFYAGGSGITGVAFAKGGKIRKAELPAIASLSAKNLNYLTDLKITDYKNITTLTVEKCPTIDLTDMLAKCTNLNRVRLTGVNLELDDTSLLDRLLKMTGLDENGYNTDHSVVEGSVHVPIMRERQLAEFTAQWPDLNITYNTLVQQFKWTFVNKDGTVLDVQYIDKGGKAVDPVTREENPIPTPTAESTISTDFTFSGWDTEFTTVFGNQTVTAVYTESVRKYTVRYMNRGAVLQETVAPYGSMVLYTGDTPVYTAEETAFKYYLFSGWDKGGYVVGDKDINAVYDVCEYVSNYFDGKEIGQLRPVEIYAMNKVGVEQTVVEAKDEVTIQLGNDFSYDDITEKVLFNEPKVFDGKTYVDTDVTLFDEDRDFVLAVDYKIDSANANNTVLMQCFEQNGMNGIKLWNSNGVKMTWGIDSANGASAGSRDMIVIRHIKGDNGLYVYSSNIYGSSISYTKIARTRITKTNATLVFGCAKADDGAYESYAKGTVYWSKLWYADLGDAACRELAAWTHDDLVVEVASFKNFYLSDNSNKRCSITFLQKDTLGQNMPLNSSSSNAGGWANTSLREYLDSRLVDALPIGWKQLVKQVKVPSSAGGKSKEIVTSDCYFFIPSAIEVSSSMIDEPYIYEGQTISYLTGNESRIKHNADGEPTKYWLRSPFVNYDGYFYAVEETGELYGFHYPSESLGVTVEFSI
mgnify:CR=1 FL=1